MPLVITLLFMAFVILISKHGLLGVRLRFDNNKRESAMRAVTSGASALNHTIKMRLVKLTYFLIGLSMKLNGKTRSRL